MFRYLAFLWNPRNPRHAGQIAELSARSKVNARRWAVALDQPGLRVLHTGANDALRSQNLSHDRGVVLGYAFERLADPLDSSPAPRPKFCERATQDIVQSAGRALVDRYWGNYVAFLRASDNATITVLKDPTGSLPCFLVQYQDVWVVFSHVLDCLELQVPLTVNLEYLRAFLTSFEIFRSLPALHQIQQVHRGEAIAFKDSAGSLDMSRSLYWKPDGYTHRDVQITDSAYAARAVRATALSCTSALIERHDALLHRLSGGFDSSIMAGVLRACSGSKRILSYTYFSRRGRAEELAWAARAAEHAGLAHVERALDPADTNLRGLSALAPTVEPIWGLQYLVRSPLERELAAEFGATATCSGDGGDSGFCSDSFAHAVVDLLCRRGLTPQALTVAAQVARRNEQTVWAVLARSLQSWLFGYDEAAHAGTVAEGCKLVSKDILAQQLRRSTEPHPWFRGRTKVSRATMLRLGNLLGMPDLYDFSVHPDEDAPEGLSPLYAQPMIELLLRIPIHVHFEAGRERGLARRAFGGDAPSEILRRRWKDRAPGFFDELVFRNRAFIRETLMDGVLVAHGLLDARAVDESLSPGQVKEAYLPAEILRHLDTELWTRRWSDHTARAAA